MSSVDTSRRLERDGTFSRRTEAVIREMILDGSLAPGDRINEVELAGELGISRGPLREAIQRLAGEGLLTVISHRGAFVRTFEPREIVELYELRAALELHAIRLLAERASDDGRTDVEAVLASARDGMPTPNGHAYPAESDFHQRLVLLVDNQALLRSWLEVHRQLSLVRTRSGQAPLHDRATVLEHDEIVAALSKRDGERAVALMRIHLTHAMHHALAVLGLTDDRPATQE
ncbi:GntR family transcriptional regulator [Actinopolymorpha pittospori]